MTIRIHEREEIAVALQIAFPDTMVNGSDNAFQHAPDPFNGVGVNVIPGKLTNRMIHGVMDVANIQIIVRT